MENRLRIENALREVVQKGDLALLIHIYNTVYYTKRLCDWEELEDVLCTDWNYFDCIAIGQNSTEFSKEKPYHIYSGLTCEIKSFTEKELLDDVFGSNLDKIVYDACDSIEQPPRYGRLCRLLGIEIGME